MMNNLRKIVKKFINPVRLDIEKKRTTKAEYEITLRLIRKKEHNEKINVVFLCHRPQVWGALQSVYDAMIADPVFNVNILAIPTAKLEKKGNKIISKYESEGAEEFWKDYHCINGYDYINDKWFDLRKLKPDYVFYQQPYNIMRPKCYASWKVARYAKICYNAYFSYLFYTINDSVLRECAPVDFMANVSLFFAQNSLEQERYKEWLLENKITKTKIFITGYPKYDNADRYIGMESSVWNYSRDSKKFRVIWTPRWTTNENNCHFFEYKDNFFKYCKENPDIDFVFRPHPQSWREWIYTGEFTQEEQNNFRVQYSKMKNMNIDENALYYEQFFSSDCLVTDMSSIIPEYLLTKKPVIFCDKINSRNTFLKTGGYGEAFYWAENWNQVEKYLEMLRNHDDPLADQRKRIVDKYILINRGNSGTTIKEIIKKDALKGRG